MQFDEQAGRPIGPVQPLLRRERGKRRVAVEVLDATRSQVAEGRLADGVG
jgi:hypothetical protein